MSRADAITRINQYYDSGAFLTDLEKLVAVPTESQRDDHAEMHLYHYLQNVFGPMLKEMGYTLQIFENPAVKGIPFLYAERLEEGAHFTVLTYGHGDVVMGHEDRWEDNRHPFQVSLSGDRIYGRGTADNKGQHLANLMAIKAVIAAKGRLGFHSKFLIETGEESGSPGLHAFCAAHQDLLKADLLIASDGPRQSLERPTFFMGSRAVLRFHLAVEYRKGGHHSGNWGGLLRNPATELMHALCAIQDRDGVIQVPEMRPTLPPENIIHAFSAIVPEDGPGGEPTIDPTWGEPGLTAALKLYAFSDFQVLSFLAGDPDKPMNAIPPRAEACCGLRYPVGVDKDKVVDGVRHFLDERGFTDVQVIAPSEKNGAYDATRTSPDNPWAQLAVESTVKTLGKKPVLLPNLAGTLPNDAFANILGLTTIWYPYSYASCSQHAPNEHLLGSLMRENLQVMTGYFYDVSDKVSP